MYDKEARRQRYLKDRAVYALIASEYYKQNKDIILKKYHLNKKTSLYYRFTQSHLLNKRHFFYKYIDILEKYSIKKHHTMQMFIFKKDSILLSFNRLDVEIDKKTITFTKYSYINSQKTQEIHPLDASSVEYLCIKFSKN